MSIHYRRLCYNNFDVLCCCNDENVSYNTYLTIASSISIFDDTIEDLLEEHSDAKFIFASCKLSCTSVPQLVIADQPFQVYFPFYVGTRLFNAYYFGASHLDRHSKPRRTEFYCLYCLRSDTSNEYPVGTLWYNGAFYTCPTFAPIDNGKPFLNLIFSDGNNNNNNDVLPFLYFHNREYRLSPSRHWIDSDELKKRFIYLFEQRGSIVNLAVFPIGRILSKKIEEIVSYCKLSLAGCEYCQDNTTPCRHLSITSQQRQCARWSQEIMTGNIDSAISKRSNYRGSNTGNHIIANSIEADTIFSGFIKPSHNNSRRYEKVNNRNHINTLQNVMLLIKLAPKQLNNTNTIQRSFYLADQGFLSILYVTEGDNVGLNYGLVNGTVFLRNRKSCMLEDLLRKVAGKKKWWVIDGQTLSIRDHFLSDSREELLVWAIENTSRGRPIELFFFDDSYVWIRAPEFSLCTPLLYTYPSKLVTPITLQTLREIKSNVCLVPQLSVYEQLIPMIGNSQLTKQMQGNKNIIHTYDTQLDGREGSLWRDHSRATETGHDDRSRVTETGHDDRSRATETDAVFTKIPIARSSPLGACCSNISTLAATCIMAPTLNNTEDGLIVHSRVLYPQEIYESLRFQVTTSENVFVHLPTNTTLEPCDTCISTSGERILFRGNQSLHSGDLLCTIALPNAATTSLTLCSTQIISRYFAPSVVGIFWQPRHFVPADYSLLEMRKIKRSNGGCTFILKCKLSRRATVGDKYSTLCGQKVTITNVDDKLCDFYGVDMIFSAAAIKRLNFGELIYGLYCFYVRENLLDASVADCLFGHTWLALVSPEGKAKFIEAVRSVRSTENRMIWYLLVMNQRAHQVLSYTDKFKRDNLTGQFVKGKTGSGSNAFGEANVASLMARGATYTASYMRLMGEIVDSTTRLSGSTSAAIHSLAALGFNLNLY